MLTIMYNTYLTSDRQSIGSIFLGCTVLPDDVWGLSNEGHDKVVFTLIYVISLLLLLIAELMSGVSNIMKPFCSGSFQNIYVIRV